MNSTVRWFWFSSPHTFFPLAGTIARWCALGAVLLAIVGAVNVPIIYYSVQWWNTLHQGASVSLTKAPTMAATMLTGMLLMALAFWLYSIATALVRVRCIIRERE